MAQATKETAPTPATLKWIELDKIIITERFREDYGDISSLTESIKDKGLLQPITLSPGLHLLAGHRRLMAAHAAGLKIIPALIRATEGEIDAREVELIENVFRKDFTWDEEVALVQEIDSLYKGNHLDWSASATGRLINKSKASISRSLQLARAMETMPELREFKTADEALKLVKKLEELEITKELHKRQTSALDAGALKRGLDVMLRVAGANYGIGDTFKGLAELKSETWIQVIECDPPYGIDLTQVKASKDSASSNVHTYNEVDKKGYPEFLTKLTKELYRVASKNCWLVFWFGPSWQSEVLAALRAAKWEVDEIPCIWTKEHGQTLQPELYLGRAWEPFYLCRKGQPILAKRGRINVFDFPGTPPNVKYHPTERPVALIQEILETLSLPSGGSVLVPFLGSGATLRACYNLGLKGWGWDLSDEYKPKFMLHVQNDAERLTEDEDE